MMETMFRASLASLAVFAISAFSGSLGACEPVRAPHVVDGELGPVPPSAARVCVLRPSVRQAELTMEIRDNGRLVGATRGSTYVCWLAAPGEHQITSPTDDSGTVLLQTQPGGHYWLHQDVGLLAGELRSGELVTIASAGPMLDRCATRVKVALPGHPGETEAEAVTPRR
jgi:hypothetical protein